MQNLHFENYEVLLKEIKENRNKWTSHGHGSEGYIDYMAGLPRLIYRVIIIPIRITAVFVELHIELQGTQHSKNSLQKEQSRQNHFLLSSILQNYINQNSVVVAQDRHLDEWNRIENLEICTWQKKKWKLWTVLYLLKKLNL